MQPRRAGRLTAQIGIACLSAGLALTLSASPAQAAALTNHKITGIENAISCLTPSLCVAVGYANNGEEGEVVTLVNGKQSRSASIGLGGLHSVSCPSRAGCWAVGPGVSDAGLVVTEIGSTGKVTKSVLEKASGANLLSEISCASLTSCELVGTDVLVNPSTPEIASWNGKKLSLHHVAGVSGATTNTLNDISCWHASCEAVGTYSYGAAQFAGFVLTVTNGKPGKIHTISDDTLRGVSCVSASKCYAAGDSVVAEGLLLTVTNGVPGSVHSETANMYGIECAGATCRASGEQSGSGGYDGVVVTLKNGSPTGAPVVDTAVDGFSAADSIAERGAGFAAVGGPRSGLGSEVAVG